MATAVDRLTIVCDCGQTMVVPAAAMYRSGLCPDCGAEVRITPENTRTASEGDGPRMAGSGLLRRQWQASAKSEARTGTDGREEAARRFASAVDLYNGKRYAESLIVLDGLLKDFPGDSHILAAREECMDALHAPRALPYFAGDVESSEEPEGLSHALVEAVLLDKLLNGDDAVQVAAARAAVAFLREAEPGHGSERPPAVEGDGHEAMLESMEARLREAAVEAVSEALGALHAERARWGEELAETVCTAVREAARDAVKPATTTKKRKPAAPKGKTKEKTSTSKARKRSPSGGEDGAA
jgi:hypothetical protein